MGDSDKLIEIQRYKGAIPTTITMAGIARGSRHSNSRGRTNFGNFNWTHITVGTIIKRMSIITIPAVIMERKTAIPKSGWLGIILQERRFLPLSAIRKGLVEKSNIE
jgi:hypothetical protein